MSWTHGITGPAYKALDGALREIWSAERDCEHPEHNTSDKHAGTAQYYVHVKHSCGLDVVEAVCGVWKGWLEADIYVACRGCGRGVKARQSILRSVSIR